jgi:hypothetical protein
MHMQSIAAIRNGVSLGAITQQELLRELDQLIAQDEEYLARMRELRFPSATKCDTINALADRLPDSALPPIADASLHRSETTRCARSGHGAGSDWR